MLTETADAAATLGLQVQLVEVRNPDDLNYAFSTLARDRAEAVFQLPSTMLFNERKRIVHLAAMYRLPSMFNAREFVQLGGLIGWRCTVEFAVVPQRCLPTHGADRRVELSG